MSFLKISCYWALSPHDLVNVDDKTNLGLEFKRDFEVAKSELEAFIGSNLTESNSGTLSKVECISYKRDVITLHYAYKSIIQNLASSNGRDKHLETFIKTSILNSLTKGKTNGNLLTRPKGSYHIS